MISFSPAFNHLFKFFWALSGYSHPSKGGHQTYSSGVSHRSQQCHKMSSLVMKCSPVRRLHLVLPLSSCKALSAPFSRVQLPQTGPAHLAPRSGSAGPVQNHSGLSMGCTAQNTVRNERVNATPCSQLAHVDPSSELRGKALLWTHLELSSALSAP